MNRKQLLLIGFFILIILVIVILKLIVIKNRIVNELYKNQIKNKIDLKNTYSISYSINQNNNQANNQLSLPLRNYYNSKGNPITQNNDEMVILNSELPFKNNFVSKNQSIDRGFSYPIEGLKNMNKNIKFLILSGELGFILGFGIPRDERPIS
jgi:hypothetical protein